MSRLLSQNIFNRAKIVLSWMVYLFFVVSLFGQNEIVPTDKPFLWKIDGKKPSYLFGTIHLSDDRVLALHQVVTDAFESSDAVYTEISMGWDEILKLMQGMMLTSDQTIQDILPQDLYRRVQKMIESKGYSMVTYQHIKAGYLATLLSGLDHQPKNILDLIKKPPLDMLFYFKGDALKKEVGGIETVDEQLAVFGSLTLKEEIELLKRTVDELEKTSEDPAEKLIQLYLQGNEETLSLEINKQMQGEDPLSKKFYDLLLTDRNVHMADRIEAKLKANPEKSYFFAVGAAHLTEKDGVLGLLSKKGVLSNRVTTHK